MPVTLPGPGKAIVHLSEYDVSNPCTAILLKSDRITPKTEGEVRHLVLELPEGDFEFVEGQSIGVLVPGPHEFGNQYHFRLYSIASSRKGDDRKSNTVSICVRRCFYIDEISGERFPGVASNYLCDAQPGDPIRIAGPYGAHFTIPADPSANLLMIGTGTGIAPFRAFVRHIYEDRGGWEGKVRLFYGARTGMEMLYHNDLNKDLNLYYNEKSFRAFEAVSLRPYVDSSPTLDRLLVEQQFEVWDMITSDNTYVFIAGLKDAIDKFDKAMTVMAGSKEAWLKRKNELLAAGKLSELIY
jgi:ferredoxin--NADP+ reductase